MGKILEAKALERGHVVCAIIEPRLTGEKPRSGAALYGSLAGALAAGLDGADAALDFSSPASAPGNIELAAEKKFPLVEGSTGWHDKLPAITALVRNAGASLLWSSNFSLGVNLFYRIAAYAAKLADPFPEYDAAGYEIHHNKKADSPSGTARTLTQFALANMTRKTKAVYDKLDRPPLPEELHFASLRVGAAPGTHNLTLDSPADTIEITHTARNREGFASGAILAAEWLVGCPGPGKPTGEIRRGVFTMDDALAGVLDRRTNTCCA
jgi:4-hydroxy-tetrahydrodipicolinate reductase